MSGGFALRPLDGGRIGRRPADGRVRAALSVTVPAARAGFAPLSRAAGGRVARRSAARPWPRCRRPRSRPIAACLRASASSPWVPPASSPTTAPARPPQPVARYSRPVDELAEQHLTEPVFAAAGIGPGSRLLCIDVNAAEIADFYARTARALGAACTAFLHLSADLDAAAAAIRRFAPTHLLTIPSLLARLWSTSPAPPRGPAGDRQRRRAAVARAAGGGDATAGAVGSVSFYGTTETGGVGAECRHRCGHHFDADDLRRRCWSRRDAGRAGRRPGRAAPDHHAAPHPCCAQLPGRRHRPRRRPPLPLRRPAPAPAAAAPRQRRVDLRRLQVLLRDPARRARRRRARRARCRLRGPRRRAGPVAGHAARACRDPPALWRRDASPRRCAPACRISTRWSAAACCGSRSPTTCRRRPSARATGSSTCAAMPPAGCSDFLARGAHTQGTSVSALR